MNNHTCSKQPTDYWTYDIYHNALHYCPWCAVNYDEEKVKDNSEILREALQKILDGTNNSCLPLDLLLLNIQKIARDALREVE